MLTTNRYPNTGLFTSLSGMQIDEDKKKYYFKLLQYIFDGTYNLEHLSKCNCGSTNLEVLSFHDRFNLPFGTLLRSIIEPLGFQFIDGSEFVRSLFRYDCSHKSGVDVSHNYEYTIQCLKEAENMRLMKLPLHMRITRRFNYYLNKLF